MSSHLPQLWLQCSLCLPLPLRACGCLSRFLGKPRPVVLQVVNGPCPIIALCSVLFLRGELVLKPDVHEVSFEQLCALLRGHLQHSVQTMALRPGASEEAVANALQNLEEVTALLPRLEQGLDINVRFNSPSSFEFTPGQLLCCAATSAVGCSTGRAGRAVGCLLVRCCCS